jgi:hypothetical protein
MDVRQLDPLRIQAVYYVASGVWPIIHLRSFYALTGAKTEGWLVQTFGLLVTAVGLVLLPRRTGDARRVQEQLATGSSLAIAAADVVFVSRRRISPIYLLDALAQLALIAALRERARP